MSRQLTQTPRYRTLADTLAREVRASYQPGDLLPTEVVLAKRFEVNRHTVRRALDELVAAGMVTRHQGRGTQVVDRRLDYAVNAGSKVTQNLAELGLATQTQCLEQGLREPPEAIAQRFGRRPGEPLLCVDTLRQVDDSPVLLLRHWFDNRRLPDWTHRYRGGSTRAVLKQHYDLRLHRRHVRIEADSANRDDTRLLNCPLNAPLLQLTSDNVDADGTLVEISIGRSRADRLAYHIDFNDLDFNDEASP
ncbi:phosphonate metabolism transcriptional regulator PhnF [Vreelandella arcis]|uniref:GntR family transcriptional regulator, phosphonate transport system regulatory protein n=1 Tax=Vreelandella arcis TaxID=416873 RepID=A0A1H0HE91_9GAMM|nr:phosphonate metabolism transcriptional regulator PhnF [Halomonas arcis]SDO17468.1 GntR family transcriptional regulator, phosphonate transport system regulatory protein [Halomonas arcis]